MFCTARPRVSSSGCQSIGPSCARAANRTSAELLVATTYSCSWASAQDHTRCKQRHTRCQASRDNPSGFDPQDQKYLSMRAEVESPFRTFRIGLLTFFLISAGIASLVATSQLIGSLGNAPSAMPLANTTQTFGIDLACVGVIAYFLRGDLAARDKQIARISREESLAGLRLQLASGKTLPLGRLRSFCRPVMFYGSAEQVAAALEAAAPFKDELLRRGVFIVPLPLRGGDASDGLPALDKDDKESARWEGRAVRREDWRDWFEKQAATAGKDTDAGLYVGLRLDGRVRASGAGCPPWGIMAKQLAPTEGMWGGFLDGMDGRVGG